MIEIQQGFYQSQNFTLGINLTIEKGEFSAVLGPSGAGKSTLLSIIAGFEHLNRGKIILDGKSASPNAAQRPVSMIFQDHNNFAHLNVWDNVALGISPSLNLTNSQKASVDEALTQVGLQNLSRRKPGEISGGERQRIALARVLVRNRPILLLDEPFAALDPGLRTSMLSLVADIQQKRNLTVLLVTHQPEEAQRVAKKVVFISNNQVTDAKPTKDFFASQDTQIRNYLGTT
jgi:thiamine transport system ATP-binding protein